MGEPCDCLQVEIRAVILPSHFAGDKQCSACLSKLIDTGNTIRPLRAKLVVKLLTNHLLLARLLP